MAIAVYGATGATGRLVAATLRRAGADLILAGRDRARLERLGAEVGAEARVAALQDPGALAAALEGCRVVLNCAGPFGTLSEPLLLAALDAGVRYADPAGEQSYIRMVHEHYGPLAERAGTALVPALGFDYALGDCAARLAAAGREPLEEVVVAYAIEGAGVADDAMRAPDAGGEVVYRDGAWRPAPAGVHRASFRFPEPLGRQPMQRYGSGEPITVPRHTRTRNVTTLITASTWAPHPALAPAVPFLRPLARVARRTALLPAVARLVSRGADGEPGPPGRFTIAALARPERGSAGSVLVQGRDFHAVTAAALAIGGRWLHEGGHEQSGALTPAQALEPVAFLDALADHGVRWKRA